MLGLQMSFEKDPEMIFALFGGKMSLISERERSVAGAPSPSEHSSPQRTSQILTM
jgi:hypothetical protein